MTHTSRVTRRQAHQPISPRTRNLVITIDGPAGVGKSTAAKLLARRLGLVYLDTGATYRALAYLVLQEQPVALSNPVKLAVMARALPLRLEPARDGGLRVFLDGFEITRAIRTQEVSEAAAQVSTFPEVRAAMVARQRELSKGRGVVVEGRDTGSVVFPDAPVKFYLTADLGVRAQRRQRELFKLYGEPTPLAQIREEIHFRDLLDQSRPVGRLVKPKGALAVDTTRLSVEQVVARMLRHIRARRPSAP